MSPRAEGEDTCRGRPRRTTPDHGGRPRLIFAPRPTPWPGEKQRVFHLLPAVTTIGSAPDADLRLDGLAERHAEIRRNAADEFYLVQLSPVRDSFVNGKRTDGRHLLRTSMRIEFADWTLSYYREEYADHGRPYGGRVGGEIGHQRPQEPREPIRTSPSTSL